MLMESTEDLTEVTFRSSVPLVSNGMLHFSSYSDFEDYIGKLRTMSGDSSAVVAAYGRLGISSDLDGISMESAARQYIQHYTQHPICQEAELQLAGFSSARQAEEAVIKAGMLDGDDDAQTLIAEAYLKSALNADYAVKIGTRIFKFYENGGVLIVLNNNWPRYNEIKDLDYTLLKSGGSVVVTNSDKSEWGAYYHIDQSGKVAGERAYTLPVTVISEVALACDIPASSFVVTQLAEGALRLEITNNEYDLYEWTLPDGSVRQGNPVFLNCSELQGGMNSIVLDVYWVSPSNPNYRRRICSGVVRVECSCGVWRRRDDQLIRTVNGQTWRIRAALWVLPGQVGCEMNYLRKRLGVWLPARSGDVRTDIRGTYKRELPNLSCIDISINRFRALGPGTFPTSVSVVEPELNRVFREPFMLNSGHTMNTQGTLWGFGITVPRLVLD